MTGNNNFNADITRWKRQWSRSGFVQGTLDTYLDQMRKYLAWCEQTGNQSNALESADEYVAELEVSSRHAARWAARAIKAYGKYLEDDDQCPNPFKRLKLPAEPEVQNAPTATDADLAKLIATCKIKKVIGSSVEWAHARDKAILLVLAHTGMRRQEVAEMQLADLDLEREVVYVPKSKTKSGIRTVALHPDAAGAVLRYLRASAHHRNDETGVWLSERTVGGTRTFTAGALSQMLTRRGEEAGVDVRAHAFRRRFAGEWMKRGGSETGLMTTAGWKTTAMISRYSKDTIEQNSIDEARRLFA
jgi:integrase